MPHRVTHLLPLSLLSLTYPVTSAPLLSLSLPHSSPNSPQAQPGGVTVVAAQRAPRGRAGLGGVAARQGVRKGHGVPTKRRLTHFTP
jgi:hypothetical protein